MKIYQHNQSSCCAVQVDILMSDYYGLPSNFKSEVKLFFKSNPNLHI